MIVILCAYLQNLYSLTPGLGLVTLAPVAKVICVCTYQGLYEVKERPFNWDLKNLVSVNKILINLREILIFYFTFLFSQQIYKDVAQKTHDYIWAVLCNLERCCLLSLFGFFLMLNNYSLEFTSHFILDHAGPPVLNTQTIPGWVGINSQCSSLPGILFSAGKEMHHF